jgi:hypothetical protein
VAEELKNTKKNEELLTEVVPTLYIALGGTGAEVLWRIRRRILNSLWGPKDMPVRLESLAEFPFAEFLHVDLDANTVTESGKAKKTDILGEKIQFKEEEKLVKKLDILKYVKTDDALALYPIIEEWFPLTRSKVNELNIDPEKGAGQIRSISRLYFFDKHQEIKSAIRNKADRLLSDLSFDDAQKRLNLQIKKGTLKIVVVASTAGGTGSGSFIDMGYLASIVGKQVATGGVTTNLVLMLPTGYKKANLERTQANTYAALMELETSMRQGSRYVKGWSDEKIRDMPETPYNDIYFIDTGNLAGAKTEQIDDIYEMVADSLFEDFSTAEFANKKRSISVNQNQHKITPYVSRVDKKTYGDMKLTFSRGYSTFGQATIDTHLDQKKNVILFRQVNGMLKAFFGVSAGDARNNSPTEAERDDLLAKRMHLGRDNEIIDYDFVAQTDIYRKGAEQTTYPIMNELLRVNGVSRIDDIEKKITDTFESIEHGGNYKEWPAKINEEITKINHDVFKAVESGSGLHEDAIKKRRNELLTELLDPERNNGLIKALWSRVDNKERGGLDYTIELIQRIKDRLENANTGLVKSLEENAKWFSDLSGHLRNEETSILQSRLGQAISKFIGAQELSKSMLQHIRNAVRLYVRYHIYAAANREASILVRELSDALGKKQGTDDNGNPIWAGFVGELEAGRTMVREIVADAENQIALTNEAMKQGHNMYIVLPAPRSKIDELELLPKNQAREWAEQAFADFGGTEQLFAMLKDDNGRTELLSKLRARAIRLIDGESQNDEINTLFQALDMCPNRPQVFADLLQRAMPWAEAKLDKYLKESMPEDQFKCFIGVKNYKEFEARYGAELKSRVPSSTVMTAAQISFVEIDQPGKLVCYVELSGLPIASMKALDDWYNVYRKADIPVHTHKRTSTFVHPRELSTDELAERAEDFKLFIEAVALGVLSRTEKGEDAGLYKLKVKGSARLIGDEKLLRLNGFDNTYKKTIRQQVDFDLDNLKKSDQLALWVALMEYYHKDVYKLALRNMDGIEIEAKGFPTLVSERLEEEWATRLTNMIESEVDRDRLLRTAREALSKWTLELPGSVEDVYKDEVKFKEIKPKRTLKPEVFEERWSLGDTQQSIVHGIAPQVGLAPPPPTGISVPPPIMQAEVYFYLMVGPTQYGPYNLATLVGFVPTGQLTAQSMVWHNGMATWTPAGLVPELAALFGPPVAGVQPPPPSGVLPPSAEEK